MGETTERGGASYVKQRMRTLNIVYERCEREDGGMAATEDKTKQQVNSIYRYIAISLARLKCRSLCTSLSVS